MAISQAFLIIVGLTVSARRRTLTISGVVPVCNGIERVILLLRSSDLNSLLSLLLAKRLQLHVDGVSALDSAVVRGDNGAVVPRFLVQLFLDADAGVWFLELRLLGHHVNLLYGLLMSFLDLIESPLEVSVLLSRHLVAIRPLLTIAFIH